MGKEKDEQKAMTLTKIVNKAYMDQFIWKLNHVTAGKLAQHICGSKQI